MARAKPGTGPLAVFVALVTAGGAAAGQPPGAVRYTADHLTVHARGVPLAEILSEVARQGGAKIVGEVRKPRDVSEDFEGVPLAKGLERLLGQQSFTLRYGRDGDLRAIVLLREALAPAASATLAPPAQEAGVRFLGGPQDGSHGVASAQRAVSDGGTVATARKTRKGERRTARERKGQHDGTEDAAQVAALLGASAQQPPATQEQPSTADRPLTPDELQRKLRRSFLNTLTQMDDPGLAAYLATPEGRRVAALLQYYADHHQSSSSNQKANGIIGRLPDQSNPPATNGR